ncbi:MAG: cell division ATP-binding protein FtsE [candidate division WOR-3 bacterium]
MIEFENVSKTYQRSWQALVDVSMKFERGEFAFIIGPTGAGKTTLLRLVYRDELPTSGRITVMGYDLTRMPKKDVPELRRHIGVIFQDFKLLMDRTVYENLEFVLRVIGTPTSEIPQQVESTMIRVGILHKRDAYPHQLSGGEQQKVSIARALVKNPDILLADEPTGNIDPKGALEVLDILKEINYQGTTVIMATHDISRATQARKRFVLVENGRVKTDAA